MYLEKINSPSDLKNLTVGQCETLAGEIREVLIKKASEIGGHLASNLGMVEVTIGLHYVFDSPKDKIVFDVSHQSYTHKILTGRKDAFLDQQKYNEVSGYTNPDESNHDSFKIGHTSTSISLACGLAKARDLENKAGNVIAVIGDGAMSGGEAFEGLDFAGAELESNLIIIFNDNQMSITENHGGIYKNLKLLRDTSGKAENNIFRNFGLDYRYVENGNDLNEVISTLKEVKDIDHPIVIHVNTKKGKGYGYAEENPESTHWVRPFFIDSGKEKNPFKGKDRYDIIIRDHLIERMKKDPKVVALIAGVPSALSFKSDIRKKLGKQFVDVGIAEEYAVSMAAGLSKGGCKPVFSTLSTFFQRTYDQISQEMCINSAAATLIVVNASIYAVNDVSHVGIFDIPLMSNIPNLVYLAPTNKQEYLAMLDWSIDQTSYPVAIRAPRNGVFYSHDSVETDYSNLNTYKVVRSGEKVAILALGDFFQMGETLAFEIEKKWGFTPTLINPRYITGLDNKMLEKIKKNHDFVITLEDGVLDGGFGQKIASFYGTSCIKVMNYGLQKKFIGRYDLDKVLEENHLRPDLIIKDLNSLMSTL